MYVSLMNKYTPKFKESTAMDTKIATACANIFMGNLEPTLKAKGETHILLWKRFMDAVFIVWTRTKQEFLHTFYEEGITTELTKNWAKSILHRMGFVKRRGNTKAKVAVEHFEALKSQFLFDIKATVEMQEIPPELVINWDQTGIKIVPVSSWTMEKRGAKRVEIAGVDDKQQITAVFAATPIGEFLPFQLICKGTTRACLPAGSTFPSD